MYWRLLSTDMTAARQIVMGEKPPITAESERLDPATLEEMCLNVGTLATVYLKPVQTVFRSARPRKLLDSPALQKHLLPTSIENQKSLSMLGMGGQPQDANMHSQHVNQNNGDLSQAVSDADAYFNSIGPQQMAAMRIDQGDVFGETTGYETGYVVNQHAPQQVVQPAQGTNGDLLVL